MDARARLPSRRAHDVIEVQCGPRTLQVGLGFFDDGRPAEVFISTPQNTTSDLANAARDIAVLLSLALQYGVPVEAVRGALTRLEDGAPAGILGAVLDGIAALTMEQAA